MGMVPKRAVNVMSCQIARFLQLTQNSIIPIGYHVQRKVSNSAPSPPLSLPLPLSFSLNSNCIHISLSSFQSLSEFHGDLFPDTAGGEPALSADQWCSGENAKVSSYYYLYLFVVLVGEKKSHPAGIEPATFRLTAERANRLRHKCLLVCCTHCISVIVSLYSHDCHVTCAMYHMISTGGKS